jgi:hypothetical protein
MLFLPPLHIAAIEFNFSLARLSCLPLFFSGMTTSWHQFQEGVEGSIAAWINLD